MTFEEINDSLPNGFHDAKLRRIEILFDRPAISLEMDIDVSGETIVRDYRRGVLEVTSPKFAFLEAPDPNYKFVFNGKPVRVDGDSVKPGQHPAVDPWLLKLPQGHTAYRFFLDEWNSFFCLAGASVSFKWADQAKS